MTFTRNKLIRILTLAVVWAALGGIIWTHGSALPAAAQAPAGDEPTLSILIVPEGDGFSIASVETPPVFKVGDIFKVSIVALGVVEPGIFGGQFELTYDTNHLAAVEGSLEPGAAMQPVVVAVDNIDFASGLVEYAASRQGDLENLPGNVVLASLRFEAVGPTEPPEGQTTVIHLENVKLGAKGGLEVPVAGLVDLEVIVRVDDTAEDGDITGNVKVEARAADNQAGHEVVAEDSLGALLTEFTAANGDFLFNDVPADTYLFTASSPGFLAASCAGVEHSADALTTLAEVTLLAGDIDASNEIDVTDAVAIGMVLGSTDPEVADLNDDGVVDILDLILMAANFGQTSDANPWICQAPVQL